MRTMRCFVIMPYGKTEEDKKKYSLLYRFFIRDAVEQLNINDLKIECIRSDIEGRGGHILSNVIDDLTESDLVIADISDLNWNVAYELGIRHALRRSGTILICNDQTVLPFDIQSMNFFIYPTDWLAGIDELVEKLRKVISSRINHSNHCDSPVHERYTLLPGDVIKSFNEATDDDLKAAKQRIAQLERELSETHEKIESMGLSLSGTSSSSSKGLSQVFIAELAALYSLIKEVERALNGRV